MHKLINYHSFTKGLDSLSNLTGLHLSLYDDKRHLVLVSTKQDPLLSVIRRHSKANKLYEDLADKNLKLALIRNKAFFMQSLTGQYHMFIPLHYEELTMIALAEAFYLTQGDFKIFYYGEQGRSLSLTERTLEEWLKELLILPSEKGTATMEDIQSVLEYLLASVYTVGQQDRHSIQSRTIVSLLSNINYNFTMNDIFQMVLDAVIFLFDVDTAAIFLRKDCYFYPAVFGDKDTQLVRDLKIPEDNRFIADVLTTEQPLSVMDSHELLHAGFPAEITSMNLFPLSSNLTFFGVLGIFNSSLDEETCDVIDDLCKLSAYLCSVRLIKEEYEHKYDELREVSTTTSSICALYQDTARLGDGIVNEASKLVDAEKCSLMLPRDQEILEVRAVKGVDRWLMENVKVRRGEGIAGRVYAVVNRHRLA